MILEWKNFDKKAYLEIIERQGKPLYKVRFFDKTEATVFVENKVIVHDSHDKEPIDINNIKEFAEI